MKLQEMPRPTKPFEFVGIDTTQLPVTNECQYILTIVCFFSRFLIVVPMKDQTTATVARCLMDNFILKYGCMDYLFSDQGRQFESNLFSDLCKLLGVNKLRCSPYHPASNGKTERVHLEIKLYLAKMCGRNQQKWAELLQYE
jgi:transposase InsO family protein